MENKDFFVSYNKENKDWAKWVAGTLEEHNYSVYLQAWDIAPGDDFIARMNEFLKHAKNYIAIWSSSFSDSSYCKKEFQTAFNEYLIGNFDRFLPIRIEDVPLDPLYQTTVYIDLFSADEESAKKLLLNGIGYTDNPRKKGAFPNDSKPINKGQCQPNVENSQFPGRALKTNQTGNSTEIRDIIILEKKPNKKGDLFNRLAYDVLHALGFCQPCYNVQKVGREIDMVLHHRTEKRIALVESKAEKVKIDGAEVNKFIGTLDVERRQYESEGNSVVGYYISQTGFTVSALEQERERATPRVGQLKVNELILLGPKEIARELIQGNVLCSLESAINAVQISKGSKLLPCQEVDLLACEYGWIWILYYSQRPNQMATHFTFVHADGNPLLSVIASKLLESCRAETPLSNLIYIDVTDDNQEEKLLAQEKYFNYLETELGEIQFEGMPTDKDASAVKVNLENIFVPLLFNCEKPSKDASSKSLNKVSINDVLNNSKRVAILAKPGGGKSTLIRRIALAYAYSERKQKVDDGLPDHDWFPIYIRCRDLGKDTTKGILEIISSIVHRAEIRQHEEAFTSLVEDALQAGRVLLLIDGLDEISVESFRISFVNQLRTFVATYPSVHLIITSRETGFRSVAGVMNSYCEQYTIADLNNEQIGLLSLKWHKAMLNELEQPKEESKKVCNIIFSDHRIKALAKNPLLLTTLLFVKRWVGYLPTKRCQLYEQMIKLLLVTWNAAAHNKLDLDESEPQLAYVAYQMTKSGKQKITRDILEQYIISARKALPDVLGYTDLSPSKFIDQVEERSSLLIQQGFEENDRGRLVPSYEFSHLSFQEYLTAKAVVESWIPECDGLLSLLQHNYNQTQWIEVVPLAAVLSGRQVRSSIEFLLKQGELNEKKKSDLKEQVFITMDDLAVLHLANCIANEVPMDPEHLQRAIVLVIANKRKIEMMYRHNFQANANVFNTIHNSKYGKRYCEIIDKVLFCGFDDKHVVEYMYAWDATLKDNHKKPTLHDILQLLNSTYRQDNIRGAYLMMEYAFNLRNNEISISTKYNNRIIYGKIFKKIATMLRSEDPLYIFCATWCISWSGYNYSNIISESLVADIVERLVELWVSLENKYNIQRMVSWAICSICKPQIQVVETVQLCDAIEVRYREPKNKYDASAAVYLGVLCNRWTKEDTQKRINGLKDMSTIRAGRFLKELGYSLNKPTGDHSVSSDD